jgi:hypothetical protein
MTQTCRTRSTGILLEDALSAEIGARIHESDISIGCPECGRDQALADTHLRMSEDNAVYSCFWCGSPAAGTYRVGESWRVRRIGRVAVKRSA